MVLVVIGVGVVVEGVRFVGSIGGGGRVGGWGLVGYKKKLVLIIKCFMFLLNCY